MKLWGALKQLLNSKKGGSVTSVMEDGSAVTDKPSIARISNTFFSTIGAKLAEKFARNVFSMKIPPVSSSLGYSRVDGLFVLKQLQSLSPGKATGLDGISARLLKLSADHVYVPLCFIINLSLNCGKFPNEWKTARVTPIF